MNSCCWHAAPSAVTIFRFTPAHCLSISLVFHLTLLEQFQIDAISQQLRLHHKSHSIYFLCFHHSCCCCSCCCLLAFWLSVQIGYSERTDFLRKMAFTWQLCAGILILLAVKTITHTRTLMLVYAFQPMYLLFSSTYIYLPPVICVSAKYGLLWFDFKICEIIRFFVWKTFEKHNYSWCMRVCIHVCIHASASWHHLGFRSISVWAWQLIDIFRPRNFVGISTG